MGSSEVTQPQRRLKNNMPKRTAAFFKFITTLKQVDVYLQICYNSDKHITEIGGR